MTDNVIGFVADKTSDYARLTKTIDTLTAQREAVKMEIFQAVHENPEMFPANIIATVGGEKYKVGDNKQLSVNADYQLPSDLKDRVIEMKIAQIRANPNDFLKVVDLVALGIAKKTENIGDDKPFKYKTVSPRFTKQ